MQVLVRVPAASRDRWKAAAEAAANMPADFRVSITNATGAGAYTGSDKFNVLQMRLGLMF